MTVIKSDRGNIIKASRCELFLETLLLDAQIDLEKEAKLMKMIAFWELPSHGMESGSFNVELYNRVLEAKKR